MKTLPVLLSFILVLLSVPSIFAHLPTAGDPIQKPQMEVSFEGTQGDFLVFVVKTESVLPRSSFVIRNESGDELYRETYQVKTAHRRIKVPRSGLSAVQFVLYDKKNQCSRLFTISTHYAESVQVTELID